MWDPSKFCHGYCYIYNKKEAHSTSEYQSPGKKYVGITPPARGTNDEIVFIIDHINAEEKGVYEDTEEGSTPLIDQYGD